MSDDALVTPLCLAMTTLEPKLYTVVRCPAPGLCMRRPDWGPAGGRPGWCSGPFHLRSEQDSVTRVQANPVPAAAAPPARPADPLAQVRFVPARLRRPAVFQVIDPAAAGRQPVAASTPCRLALPPAPDSQRRRSDVTVPPIFSRPAMQRAGQRPSGQDYVDLYLAHLHNNVYQPRLHSAEFALRLRRAVVDGLAECWKRTALCGAPGHAEFAGLLDQLSGAPPDLALMVIRRCSPGDQQVLQAALDGLRVGRRVALAAETPAWVGDPWLHPPESPDRGGQSN